MQGSIFFALAAGALSVLNIAVMPLERSLRIKKSSLPGFMLPAVMLGRASSEKDLIETLYQTLKQKYEEAAGMPSTDLRAGLKGLAWLSERLDAQALEAQAFNTDELSSLEILALHTDLLQFKFYLEDISLFLLGVLLDRVKLPYLFHSKQD